MSEKAETALFQMSNQDRFRVSLYYNAGGFGQYYNWTRSPIYLPSFNGITHINKVILSNYGVTSLRRWMTNAMPVKSIVDVKQIVRRVSNITQLMSSAPKISVVDRNSKIHLPVSPPTVRRSWEACAKQRSVNLRITVEERFGVIDQQCGLGTIIGVPCQWTLTAKW